MRTKLIAALISLFIPGTGHVLLGRSLYGLLLQTTAIFIATLLALSGAIYSRSGLLFLVTFVFGLSFLSAVSCFATRYNKPSKIDILKSILFSVIFIFFFALGFKYKDRLLGVSLYFIPSNSMSPTLLPGDLILADARKRSLSNLKEGNVVVFQSPNAGLIAIKRIKRISSPSSFSGNKFYLVGDNARNSIDSRSYGEVDDSFILAEARIILFNIKDTKRILKSIDIFSTSL